MASVIKGVSGSQIQVDSTSKALRITPYNTIGVEVSPHNKATYVASGVISTAPAGGGDYVTIFGSSSRIIRVISIYIATTRAAGAGSGVWRVIKRSSVNSGGTFIAATMVPVDSGDAAATATSVGHYTATNAPGSIAGFINNVFVAAPVAVPNSFAGIVEDAGKECLPWYPVAEICKPVTLRGTSEGVGVGWNGSTTPTHTYRIVWTEE